MWGPSQDLLRASAPTSCDNGDSFVGTVPSFYISDLKGSCKLSGAVIPAQGRVQTPEHQGHGWPVRTANRYTLPQTPANEVAMTDDLSGSLTQGLLLSPKH